MIKLNNIEIKIGSFPNGETYIDLPNSILSTARMTGGYFIDLKFEGNEDVWSLMQIVDKLKQTNKPRHLILYYTPYSRMDRAEQNRLFSLKTFAALINGMDFQSVTIMEPHSDVTPALFNNVRVKNMSMQLAMDVLSHDFGISATDEEQIFQDMADKKICMCWPDSGAEKRYFKQFQCPHTLTVSKERDFKTGYLKIKHVMGVDDHQDCEHVIIVDDLCAKGTTFILAAKALREKLPNLKTITLCVTHCENTIFDGEIFKTDLIDKVYTTDSLLDVSKFETADYPKLNVKLLSEESDYYEI